MPPRGQTWTTLDALSKSHMNGFHEYDTGIIGIGSQPSFAIGQRALLVRTERGNVLWDCIATLDMATINMIKGLGGLKAIAISHPHFYTTMVEWARAFDCPIHLNSADSDWIIRKDGAIKLWTGDTLKLWDGVTLVRCGGHFPGGTVMHWAGGAGGRGIICAGDILSVATDRKWLSFMRSYPNFIPLSAREVEHIGQALAPFQFDLIYGHYFDRVIAKRRQTGAGKIRRALCGGNQRDTGILSARKIARNEQIAFIATCMRDGTLRYPRERGAQNNE